MRASAYLGLLAAGMAAALLPVLPASGAAGAAPGPTGLQPLPLLPTPAAASRGAGRDANLDEDDEIAALEAIRVALTEVGDGVSFVWHRRYGKLGGLVQPTQSFKDGGGRICRHIIVILNAGRRSARFEGTACRLGGGRWQLDG